jgi:hypothetical protein
VYLFIAGVLCIVAMFCNAGNFVLGGEVTAYFSNFTFSVTEGSPLDNYESSGPWALGVVLAIVAALSFYTIFIFNHRMLQVRLTVFSTILLVGYYGAYAFFAWLFNEKINASVNEAVGFQLTAASILPLLALIFNLLAIRGIRKDEALVRSLDKIR